VIPYPVLLVPLLVLAVVAVFAFTGCVSDAPDFESGKAAAVAYPALIVEEAELRAYWRLNEIETGDQTAYDSGPSVPRHNGEYRYPKDVSKGEKGPLTEQDPNDKAADFAGQRAYVEVPYDQLLNPPMDFSVEAWIRPVFDPTLLDPTLKYYAGGVISSYEAGAPGGAAVDKGFRIWVDVEDGNKMVHGEFPGNEVIADLGDGVEHDGWRHIVLTYSAYNDEANLYVNADRGDPLATDDKMRYQGNANTSQPLRIAATASDQWGFRGRIAEIALYGRVLFGSEVKTHFLNATSRQ
jgi:hypothetical protein